MRRAVQSHGWVPPAACGVLALCLLVAGRLQADPLPTVTVQAQREQLRQQVNQFVAQTIVRPHNDDSLLRWDTPICPLVAGLPREQGEFFLQRISQAARDAKAPLAGEKCRPNLYVIVAANPANFLKLWWRHDVRLFSTANGVVPVQRFIDTPRAVRVWYNNQAIDPASGAQVEPLLAQSLGPGGASVSFPVNYLPGRMSSRLQHMMVRNVQSAIVIIDAQQMSGFEIGQLADYVSMVSLAEINLDKDVGNIPSILTLFRHPAEAPQELTVWDRSLLHAVYTSRQQDTMQFSEICTGTLDALVAARDQSILPANAPGSAK
ncbi:MAG TPA: hypothetical protein VK695_02455 [Steroidobacteraceae bacterium]|jgi:hypothetical protein|nr:hypothetical protein [Steroidobacteraceae bacterium]